MAVERVSAEDIKLGALVEKAEHPWMTMNQATRTSRDHITENKNYYGEHGNAHPQSAGTVVILNQNVKAMPPHKKKKPPQPQPFNILNYGMDLLDRR